MGVIRFRGHPAVPGAAAGVAAVTDVPLSFWGGVDPDSSEVIDRRHPLSGVVVAGMVLVMPAGRGSCTASGVLLETIRHGVAPVAIVLSRHDPIIGLGAILGEEIYGRTVPVVIVAEADRVAVPDAAHVEIRPDGTVVVSDPSLRA